MSEEFSVVVPDIDARNNLLVDESFLQLVRLLVALLDGELLDLSQLARERLVLTAALSEAKQELYIWFSNQVVFRSAQSFHLDC